MLQQRKKGNVQKHGLISHVAWAAGQTRMRKQVREDFSKKVREAHEFEEQSNGYTAGNLACDEGSNTQEDKHLTGLQVLLKGAQAPKCWTVIERF